MNKEEFKKQKYIKLFIDYINQKNYSVNTLISYINDLYYFYEFVNIDLINVTENDIRNYLEYLNKNKEKASSVRRKISTFKSFYKFYLTYLFKLFFFLQYLTEDLNVNLNSFYKKLDYSYFHGEKLNVNLKFDYF